MANPTERVTNTHFCPAGGGWDLYTINGGTNDGAFWSGEYPDCLAQAYAGERASTSGYSQSVDLTGVNTLHVSWYHYGINWGQESTYTRIYIDNDLIYDAVDDSEDYPEILDLPISYTGVHTVRFEIHGTLQSYVDMWVMECSALAVVNPPVVEFSGSPTSGLAPLDVIFTDSSTNSPESWTWDFGDGATSTEQNPTHQYTDPGTYTVRHSATNAGGTGSNTKTDYITITGPWYVYAEVGDDGTEVYNMAKGFWDEIITTSNWNAWKNAQGSELGIIGPDDAREGHWRSTDKGGNANNWIERSDFAYFSGHGSPRLINFKITDENSNLETANAENVSMGAGRLKWAVLDTCLSLDQGDESSVETSWMKWKSSFDGLRMLLGWHTTTFPTSRPNTRGQVFAQLMKGTYNSNSPLTLIEAWDKAGEYTMASYYPSSDTYTAEIYDSSCSGDKLPGYGGYSTSPGGTQEYRKTLVAEQNIPSPTTPPTPPSGLHLSGSRTMTTSIGDYSIRATIPVTSKNIMIYTSARPDYTQEKVSSLSRKLGLSAPIRQTASTYGISSGKDEKIYLDIQKNARIIAFDTFDNRTGSSLSVTKAVDASRKFLKNSDLLPTDALDPSVAYNEKSILSAKGEIKNAGKTTVVTYPRQLNGLMVWNSQLFTEVNSEEKVVSMFMNWRDYIPYKQVPLKTLENAFAEFQKNPLHVENVQPGKVIVDRVSLVYYTQPAIVDEKYLQPIYVFEGYVQNGSATERFIPVAVAATDEVFEEIPGFK